MPSGKTDLPEGVEDCGAFQRKFWVAQRVASVLFALILIGCLFGALGRGGYLSRTLVTSELGVLDFPALTRWNAPDDLVVTFSPSAEDRVFFVDGRFFEAFSVEGTDPPKKATLVKDGLTGYVFSSDPSKPTRVTFRLQTQMPGLRTAAFGIDGEVAERTTFVFP
ncbi:hypothetical protein AS026_30850 [Rhizobium altiplani]|uniref:Uncharacterized protein n=1 Tax=Rhizobium altiplani TaxID=1864509 RepID=A0A109JZ66_9HYPH|nr:hypothetical protein [Rhizobium altiplani]KWV57705.1 hypothetical protein AS026_30850 [Rhizobium altiplani]